MPHPLLTRKLPDCPQCGEDELWCPYDYVKVRCNYCGWDSGLIIVWQGGDVSGAIEFVVRGYHAKPESESENE